MATTVETLPHSKQIAYTIGPLGWSTLIDIVEAMCFAARTLMQKFGQTFGVVGFAMLTTFGRDVGDDLGVRLSGIVGFVRCLAAGFVFMRYDEATVTATADE